MNQGRLLHTGGPVYRGIVAGYLILAIGCTLGLYFTFRATGEIRSEIRTRCMNEALNRAAIRTSLLISRGRIEHVAYYKTHPAEKRQALADTNAALARFPAIHC